VDIFFTVCGLFLCVYVRLRISPLRKLKLATSNLAWRFISVQGMEQHIFVNFARQKPKIGRIGEHAGHTHPNVNISVEMRRSKRYARDAPFVEYRAVCGRRIGMCG